MPGRKEHDEDASQKLHFLLPVKSNDGVQMRYRRVDADSAEEVPEQKKKAAKKLVEEGKPAKKVPSTVNTDIKLFATDPNWKQRTASLSFDVLENPEKNLRCVKELLNGLTETDIATQISVVLMASLTEIFKDILPGYRIHIASEVEQEQQMKKETLHLRQHEEALLGMTPFRLIG